MPFLEQMKNPGLWVFAENDLSIPVERSIAVLDYFATKYGKDFSYFIIPDANHNWIINGAICEGRGKIADVLPEILAWIHQKID